MFDIEEYIEELKAKKASESKNSAGVYNLRLYDDNLMTFSLSEEFGLEAKILSCSDEKKHLFPLDLELSDRGIVKWLQRRVIPKNRRFVHEILRALNFTLNDTKGIIDVGMGLSLNDSYWIVPDGFDGKFSDYNLYENRFSESLSLVAFTGTGCKEDVFASPELTTNGMLRKAWRFIEGDGIYLYKGGTEGAANAGNEPYSEYYAAQIAETMGLNHVGYDLENWKGILASKCRLFTDIDTSFVPIGRAVKDIDLKTCLEYYKSLGEDFYEQLCSMLVFDALIYNEDRHFGNFGLLRNNRTGKIIAPAPIFDNGRSLFNFAMDDDLENLDEYAAGRTNPYYVTFDSLCKKVMGPKQKEQLQRMKGFKFRRHPSLNLPEERLRKIEKYIVSRASRLMEIPVSPNRFGELKTEETELLLPERERKLIADYERSYALMEAGTPDYRFDLYFCELQSTINSMEADGLLTSEQAWYLREKHLGISREDNS